MIFLKISLNFPYFFKVFQNFPEILRFSNSQRCRDDGKKFYLCFIDYRNQESIQQRQGRLMKILKRIGIPDKERIIPHLNWNQKAVVKWEGKASEKI